MKKIVTAVLMASLVLVTLPVYAEPAPPAHSKATTLTAGPLAASIDRAVAQAGVDPRVAVRRGTKIRATQGGMGMSGGGGGTGKYIVMMLLGTAISVGTYYLIMKKANEQTAKQAGLR